MSHDGFYCNRRYAAATSLRAACSTQAGGLAAQSINVLLRARLPPSQLRAPVSHSVLAVSSRIVWLMRVLASDSPESDVCDMERSLLYFAASYEEVAWRRKRGDPTR